MSISRPRRSSLAALVAIERDLEKAKVLEA